MNNLYKKKFTIGLSLDITLNEYEELFKEFGDYICSVYFSPPLGEQFHSRKIIAEQFRHKRKIDLFYDILNLIKNNGIPLDAVLNTYSITSNDIEKFIEFVNHYEIDEVTTLEEYGERLHKKLGINLTYSFNNGNKTAKDLADIPEYFDTVVLGTSYFHSPEIVNKIANDYKVKILPNNGCSVNCATCRNGSVRCRQVVESNLSRCSIDELFAIQSYFPWELKRLLEFVENTDNIIVKISNRSSDYKYLRNCLSSYIDNTDVEQMINNNKRNYYLWCRLGAMIPYYDDANITNIQHIKMNIWNKYEKVRI